jgi:hypothetical protein
MTPTARRKLLLSITCVLVLLVSRGSLSMLLLQHGFRALSDDDYSRVVIAQAFAQHPSLDPSQTSWLPFPFWLYGTLTAIFGQSLIVARAVAFAIGLCSTLIIWQAARWMGLSRGTSVFGGLVAMSIPYSAWLGLATTPDVYSAALLLLGCSSLARKQPTIRTFGATAVIIASLSRYEAWPVALLWALFTGLDAARLRRWRYAFLALLVAMAPALWMLHGRVLHHDAFFFIKRVTDYHRALGTSVTQGCSVPALRSTFRCIADAPELWSLVLVVALARLQTTVRLWQRRWTRPICGALSVMVFLSIGDWRDSTATHHAGRTLLAAWYLLSLLIAAGFCAQVKVMTGLRRSLLLIEALIAVLVAALVVRPRLDSVDAPQNRAEEVQIGLVAAAQIPPGEHLAIETRDYGYFAVQAAFARPFDVQVVNERDPRRRTEALSGYWIPRVLAARSIRWLVAERRCESQLPETAIVRYRSANLLLAKLP